LFDFKDGNSTHQKFSSGWVCKFDCNYLTELRKWMTGRNRTESLCEAFDISATAITMWYWWKLRCSAKLDPNHVVNDQKVWRQIVYIIQE